ncbi:MAG: hypothetical protein ABIA93_01030 [Candidatus Woesearchaeota archaeon]
MKWVLLLVIIGAVILAACNIAPQPIGGGRDAHGCLGPAGYSWDAEIQACARNWEMNESLRKIAKIAVDSIGPKNGLTVVSIEPRACTGCFLVMLDINQKQTIVQIDNWTVTQDKYVDNVTVECTSCPQYTPPVEGWCDNGTVVPSEPNECGCQGPPKCVLANKDGCTVDSDCEYVQQACGCHTPEFVEAAYASGSPARVENCAYDVAQACSCVNSECVVSNRQS